MKIAILSDSHNNLYNITKALEKVEEMGIEKCFHLGDFINQKTIEHILEQGSFSWSCVWGNCDTEKESTFLAQKDNPRFDIVNDSYRELEIGGRKIFLTHFPEIADVACGSGKFDAVFHGHDHIKRKEVLLNGTLRANPGEIMGNKTGQPSFGIWNTENNEFEILDLDDFKLKI